MRFRDDPAAVHGAGDNVLSGETPQRSDSNMPTLRAYYSRRQTGYSKAPVFGWWPWNLYEDSKALITPPKGGRHHWKIGSQNGGVVVQGFTNFDAFEFRSRIQILRYCRGLTVATLKRCRQRSANIVLSYNDLNKHTTPFPFG